MNGDSRGEAPWKIFIFGSDFAFFLLLDNFCLSKDTFVSKWNPPFEWQPVHRIKTHLSTVSSCNLPFVLNLSFQTKICLWYCNPPFILNLNFQTETCLSKRNLFYKTLPFKLIKTCLWCWDPPFIWKPLLSRIWILGFLKFAKPYFSFSKEQIEATKIRQNVVLYRKS